MNTCKTGKHNCNCEFCETGGKLDKRFTPKPGLPSNVEIWKAGKHDKEADLSQRNTDGGSGD